jgi:hypothetical protein
LENELAKGQFFPLARTRVTGTAIIWHVDDERAERRQGIKEGSAGKTSNGVLCHFCGLHHLVGCKQEA